MIGPVQMSQFLKDFNNNSEKEKAHVFVLYSKVYDIVGDLVYG